jgi:hypothetical protein
MPICTLVLKNISTISYEEMNVLLELAGLHERTLPSDTPDAATAIGRLEAAVRDEDNQLIRRLLRPIAVRKELYVTIKARTEKQVILHEDVADETSPELDFILSQLESIRSGTVFRTLYIGGGHGDSGFLGSKVLSGITWFGVQRIARILQERSIQFDSMILHSCSSGVFLRLLRPFLAEQGIILSYNAETGSSGVGTSVLNWEKEDFFSAEDLAKPWTESEEGLAPTTLIVSHKNTNLMMNFELGYPAYVDLENIDAVGLAIEWIQEEPNVITTIENNLEQYNTVEAMSQFNKTLGRILAPVASTQEPAFFKKPASVNKDAATAEPPRLRQ